MDSYQRRRNPSIGWPCWLVCLAALAATALCAEQAADLAEGTRALYRGDAERAVLLARKHLRAQPEATSARMLLAQAEISRGKLESAFKELLKVLRAEPNNLDALYYLGRVCTMLMQAEYEKLYAMAPDSARVHQLLAESHMAQGDLGKAEEEFLAALQSDPHSVPVLDAMGELKRFQFRFDDAISLYSQAQKIAPGDYDSAYGLGACYLYKQEPQRAVEHLRHALAIDPDSAAARLALGDALLRAGQDSEAVVELRVAVALEPNMRQAFTLLARAYRRLGQTREAEEALKKSEELTRKEQESRLKKLASDDLFSAPPPVPAPASSEPENPDQ